MAMVYSVVEVHVISTNASQAWMFRVISKSFAHTPHMFASLCMSLGFRKWHSLPTDGEYMCRSLKFEVKMALTY